MATVFELVKKIKAEILAGQHGDAEDRFMTVRELAGRYGVSLTTAHRVMNKLKEMGALIGDSTNPAIISSGVTDKTPEHSPQLGLLVPSTASPFFGKLSLYIHECAANMGYEVLTINTEHDFQRERKAIDNLLRIGVVGFVICPGLGDESARLYKRLLKQNKHIVFVNREVEGVETDSAVVDNFAGGASVAEHFISMGYDSFGYIAFGPRLKRRDMRFNGYRSALFAGGFNLTADHVADDDGWDIQHGYNAMAKLMKCDSPPRAVFAFNDLPAIGALHYCREHGIGVPEQVAIAGFDDVPETRVTTPALTTVSYPIQTTAQLAVQSLDDAIRSSSTRACYQHHVTPTLVVRGSTDPNVLASAPRADNHASVYAGVM